MPETFFRHADEGKIVIKKASKWWFWNGGIEFDDGSRSEFDVVIMATGFDGKKKLNDIFPPQFRTFLHYPSGMMPLYRWVTFFFFFFFFLILIISEIKSYHFNFF